LLVRPLEPDALRRAWPSCRIGRGFMRVLAGVRAGSSGCAGHVRSMCDFGCAEAGEVVAMRWTLADFGRRGEASTRDAGLSLEFRPEAD
jgi:hypothetical protein